jgi:predicted ester cyclase
MRPNGSSAPGYVHHTMGGRDGDIDAFTSGFVAVVGTFPDITYTVGHVIHEADLVAAYLSDTGHHEGEFFGLALTGTLTTFRGAYHCRLAGEKDRRGLGRVRPSDSHHGPRRPHLQCSYAGHR